MYKLTVIAGPNRGTSYALNDGQTTIGRQSGNVIMLPSAKVSKRHCVLVASNGQIVIQDAGSSNGTFVNGVLIKQRPLQLGDRISVGEFVFELKKATARAAESAPPVLGLGENNIVPFPNQHQLSSSSVGNIPGISIPAPQQQGGASAEPMEVHPLPTDLKGKFLWYFERYVMPFFYGMNLKKEWRSIAVGSAAFLVIANLVLSIYPLMESSERTILLETSRRAKFMASQIANLNAQVLANRAESQTSVGTIEQEEGVRVAVIADMNNRIIAPASKQNHYLASGVEARTAVQAAKLFNNGRETGVIGNFSDQSTLVAVEPIKVLDSRVGRNVTIAMAIVSLDTSLSIPDFGTLGITYSNTLIITAILAAFIFFVLYRMTLKPFEVLNEDIDKVLKGEMTQVTHEFRWEELNQLWDVINSSLQRIPKGGGDLNALGQATVNIDEFLSVANLVADTSNAGVVLCDKDRKIVHMSPMFEEISGIRSMEAVGQDIPSVARDQALGALATDMFDQALNQKSIIGEDFEFSGVPYRMKAVVVGSTQARGYVLVAQRSEAG